MRPPAWKVGLYSKVILTVIAVSLVGLLVRQLPRDVEAKPEMYEAPKVDVVLVDVPSLRATFMAYLKRDRQVMMEGKSPLMLDAEMRELFQATYDLPAADTGQLLNAVLQYKYAIGYRVKFATNDFIILESE